MFLSELDQLRKPSNIDICKFGHLTLSVLRRLNVKEDLRGFESYIITKKRRVFRSFGLNHSDLRLTIKESYKLISQTIQQGVIERSS